MRSLVFYRIFIGNVYLYFYGRVDVDLVHYGGETYFQFFLLTIGSIMEWDVDMSTSTVYGVSKNSSIVKFNLVYSLFLCISN